LDDGRKYYYHSNIATTQWEVPPGWIENTVACVNSGTASTTQTSDSETVSTSNKKDNGNTSNNDSQPVGTESSSARDSDVSQARKRPEASISTGNNVSPPQKKPRGPLKCGRCGEPKKGHTCAFKATPKEESAAVSEPRIQFQSALQPALQYQGAPALQPAAFPPSGGTLDLFEQAFPTYVHGVRAGPNGQMYTGGAYPLQNASSGYGYQ